MKEQLSKKLNFVLKEKLINELGLEKEQEKKMRNKTKEYIIKYILDNSLISTERINELYYAYKDSSNSVLYLLESNTKKIDYSLINEKRIKEILNRANKIINEEKISDFTLENYDINENGVTLEFTYKKKIDIIFGGIPDIKGYKSGDIVELKILKDVSVFHFNNYNKFIVKCNDWSAMKSIKNIINDVFLCTVYHPKFDKDIIEKITINSDGKNHIIKASYQNQGKYNSQPALVSISDEGLKDIDIYNELEGDLNYNKVFNCFRVDINSRQRFVGISNTKGKMWIPSILHKDELSQYAKGILERISLSLQKLKETPEKYIRFHKDYRLDKNYVIDNILKQISQKIVSDEKYILLDEFIYNIVRYGKSKFFKIVLQPYFCEEHQFITDIRCPKNPNHQLEITTDNNKVNKGKVFAKCKKCKHKHELLEFVSSIKTDCCNKSFEMHSYTDMLTILPTQYTIQKINEFLDILNYEEYKIDYFYINAGQLIIKRDIEQKQFLDISYFKPFKKIIECPLNEGLYSELNKISERCIKTNPRAEFCEECYNGKDGTSLQGIDLIKDKLRKSNSTRICLPRLIGYVTGLSFDGIHNGYEKADIKFLYDENTGKIIPFSSVTTNGYRKIGIHVKSPEKNDPKNCNNPKITSALGHIITSKFRKDFDIIGFAMPNNLNEEILNELEFLCNGLGIDLLIIDKEDWLKVFYYYKEQKMFDIAK